MSELKFQNTLTPFWWQLLYEPKPLAFVIFALSLQKMNPFEIRLSISSIYLFEGKSVLVAKYKQPEDSGCNCCASGNSLCDPGPDVCEVEYKVIRYHENRDFNL